MPGFEAWNTRKRAWITYGIWAFWVGIAFFSVYPVCNWITARRENTLALYVRPELDIPFVPEWIWAYLSMYVLFALPPLFLDPARLRRLGKQLVAATLAAGCIFLLFPAALGFQRAVPESPFYGALYTALFDVDRPHNLVPSLHVVFSALIILMLLEVSASLVMRAVFWGWLLLLCLSTLLVHQHHVLDVAAGLVLAFLFHGFSFSKGENNV